MKRICLILLTIILINPVVVAATDFTEIVKAVMPSVFYITAYDETGKPLRLGTGFFANGLIITNYHVIQHASRVTVNAD